MRKRGVFSSSLRSPRERTRFESWTSMCICTVGDMASSHTPAIRVGIFRGRGRNCARMIFISGELISAHSSPFVAFVILLAESIAPQGFAPHPKSGCFAQASSTPSPPLGSESQLTSRVICIFQRQPSRLVLLGLQVATLTSVEGSCT